MALLLASINIFVPLSLCTILSFSSFLANFLSVWFYVSPMLHVENIFDTYFRLSWQLHYVMEMLFQYQIL